MAPLHVYALEQSIAEQAVLRASILTKQVQSRVQGISKDDNSPVTVADFAAQALLIGALHHAFPHDAFLGEETSAALRADKQLCDRVYRLVLSATEAAGLDAGGIRFPKPATPAEMLRWIDLGGSGKGGDEGRFWVMDPVDGTATFLRGQQYAVSLSLVEDGKEVVGVLGCPNISADTTRVSEDDVDGSGFGILLTAVRGRGSTVRRMAQHGLGEAFPLHFPEPCRSNKLRIVGCTACEITRHDVIAELAEIFKARFPNIEIWSSHIRYAALILGGGNAQFWVPAASASKMHIWDHAGTQLIFTELGGKITDLDGKDVDFGAGRDLNRNRGLVVAREEIHQTLLLAMNKIIETH